MVRQHQEAPLERYRGFVALHSALLAGPEVRVGRLWLGGLVTALCAALMAALGAVIGRGLLDIPVPVPMDPKAGALTASVVYALSAAALTVQATALLHVLMAVSPKPISGMAWVCGPITAIVALLPLIVDGNAGARLATAGINLVIGLTAMALLAGVATISARWPGPPSLDDA